MASPSTVEQLESKIDDEESQPSVLQQDVDAESRPSGKPDFDVADQSTTNGVSVVRRLTRQIEEKRQARSISEQEVETALQQAVNDVCAAGHAVTQRMMQFGRNEARLGKGNCMKEQIHRVLLREVAVQSALNEAAQNGVETRSIWGDTRAKEGEARLAAGSTGSTEYEAMLANALRAVSSEKLVYVVTVSSYKRVGLGIVLSLQSLGEAFEMTVDRETSVAQVTHFVQQERLWRRPAGPGKIVEVKLVGRAGTLLPLDSLISCALDCEGEEVEHDDENGVFYPLPVLTGEVWKGMGLLAQTRWKHVREKDFRNLFGMSKDAFERLPAWKQIPLKKKHGLF